MYVTKNKKLAIFSDQKLVPSFIGGDHKRLGYVQYVPVIYPNIP